MTRAQFLAAVLVPAALAAAAPSAALAEQGGHMEQGVWVPAGNTLAEVLERQAANRQMSDLAHEQVTENEQKLKAAAQAQAAYEAELARVEQETKDREAANKRDREAYEAAMAKWRADVAACQAGDKSRCAPPAAK